MIGTEGTAGGVAPSTEGGVDAMRTMLLQRRHEGLSAFLAPSSRGKPRTVLPDLGLPRMEVGPAAELEPQNVFRSCG